MNWKFLAVVLGLIPLVGCVTTSGNQLTDSSPSPGKHRPAVEQTVGDFSFHLDGGKMVTSNKMGREINDEILDHWKKEGFVEDHVYVKSSGFSDSSVFRITLSGHQEGESSIFLQIISGLTLAVIPYSVNSKMDIRYSLENSETGCVFEADASDSYKTFVGLLLIPATPFSQGGKNRTFARLSNSLYGQLAEQGAFDDHERCEKSASQEPTTTERLRQLEKLRREGLISESEHERKRALILDSL